MKTQHNNQPFAKVVMEANNLQGEEFVEGIIFYCCLFICMHCLVLYYILHHHCWNNYHDRTS
jgi:hypothetical protein